MVSQSYVCTENKAILSLQQLAWSFKSSITTRASLQFWSAYKKNRYRVPFLVLGLNWFFRLVPVSVLTPQFLRFQCTGSGTLVLVTQFWYLGPGTSVLVSRSWYLGSGTLVLIPRFWYLGSGSYFSLPGFRYKVFRKVICIFLILVVAGFHFDKMSIWNLKLIYWNLSWLEPKKFWYQNTKVAGLTTIEVLAQH